MDRELIHEDVQVAVARARAAQAEAALWPQARVDDVVEAVGWQCYRDGTARRLAALSQSETRLGDTEHLYALHRERVLGTMRDLHGQVSTGVVEVVPDLGLRRIAKPMGVIAVASPATAPSPGIACLALAILKTRNAAIFSPNPRARSCGQETVDVIRAVLDRVGAPPDLIQCVTGVGRDQVVELMASCDFVVAVGGVGTVHRAYTSGTPAVGAGVGNPTVIVDETADVEEAARKIHTGAGYNHGTSCSSESNALVHATVVEQFRAELLKGGAHLCTPEETARVRSVLWVDDKSLNRDLIGRSAGEIATAAQIGVDDPEKTSVLVLDCADPRAENPILREKLAPVLTLSTFEHFDDALDLAAILTDRCGRGHSCAIHTSDLRRADRLAERVDTCRLVVNQSTSTNAGSFESGVSFSAVLSSGTWGGGSVSGNVTWRHFLNHTTITVPIPEHRPSEEALFGRHWSSEIKQDELPHAAAAQPR